MELKESKYKIICWKCEGTGEIVTPKRIFTCKFCNGTGYQPIYIEQNKKEPKGED